MFSYQCFFKKIWIQIFQSFIMNNIYKFFKQWNKLQWSCFQEQIELKNITLTPNKKLYIVNIIILYLSHS